MPNPTPDATGASTEPVREPDPLRDLGLAMLYIVFDGLRQFAEAATEAYAYVDERQVVHHNPCDKEGTR